MPTYLDILRHDADHRSGSTVAMTVPLARPRSMATSGTGGLVVEYVTDTYRNRHTALRDASFAIPCGTIATLVGVDGSGKSTGFKAIMGFVPLAAGRVSLLEEALRRNMVAYVPQSEDVD